MDEHRSGPESVTPRPPKPPPADARAAARPERRWIMQQEFDDPVDEASADSFPASDPPAWTLGMD